MYTFFLLPNYIIELILVKEVINMSSFRELGKKANLTQEELIAQFTARYNKKGSIIFSVG